MSWRWSTSCPWLASLGILVLFVGGSFLAAADRPFLQVVGVVVAAAMVLVAIGALARMLASEVDGPRLRRLVLLSYGFTILALLASVSVTSIVTAFPVVARFLAHGPVGLVVGCASDFSPGDAPKCGIDGPEWVVNIGGRVGDPICGSVLPCPPLDELRGLLEELLVPNGDLPATIAKLRTFLERVGWPSPERAAFEEALAKPVPADDAGRKALGEGLHGAGGRLLRRLDSDRRAASISGGLRVPLYFEVLALVGGAISMMRRVPEYQRRASAAYREEYERAKAAGQELPAWISREGAREFLVFQILQLMSAPFIGLAAWALVEPEQASTAVALGFIAGFASEPVLLMIRALADKVRPDATRPPPPPAGEAEAGEPGATPAADGARAVAQLDAALKEAAPLAPREPVG